MLFRSVVEEKVEAVEEKPARKPRAKKTETVEESAEEVKAEEPAKKTRTKKAETKDAE